MLTEGTIWLLCTIPLWCNVDDEENLALVGAQVHIFPACILHAMRLIMHLWITVHHTVPWRTEGERGLRAGGPWRWSRGGSWRQPWWIAEKTQLELTGQSPEEWITKARATWEMRGEASGMRPPFYRSRGLHQWRIQDSKPVEPASKSCGVKSYMLQ